MQIQLQIQFDGLLMSNKEIFKDEKLNREVEPQIEYSKTDILMQIQFDGLLMSNKQIFKDEKLNLE